MPTKLQLMRAFPKINCHVQRNPSQDHHHSRTCHRLHRGGDLTVWDSLVNLHMGKATASPIVDQARLLLNLFQNSYEKEVARHADDILLYFRKLHDNYEIAKSTSPRFSGKTFVILEEVIYQLESHPDRTLRNSGMREFIVLVLEDITKNRIQLEVKGA